MISDHDLIVYLYTGRRAVPDRDVHGARPHNASHTAAGCCGASRHARRNSSRAGTSPRRSRALTPPTLLAGEPSAAAAVCREHQHRTRLRTCDRNDLHPDSTRHRGHRTAARRRRSHAAHARTHADRSRLARAVGADSRLQRAQHDRADPRTRCTRCPVREGDHLRQRLLHRRHEGDPRSAVRRRAHSSADSSAAQHGEGRRDSHGARRRARATS